MLKKILEKKEIKFLLLPSVIIAFLGGILTIGAYAFYEWSVLGWDNKEIIVKIGMSLVWLGMGLFFAYTLVFLEKWWLKMGLSYLIIFLFVISLGEFIGDVYDYAGYGYLIVFGGLGIVIITTLTTALQQLFRFFNYQPLVLFIILVIPTVLLVNYFFSDTPLKSISNLLPGENNFCERQNSQAEEKIENFVLYPEFAPYLPVWKQLFKKANNLSNEFFEENIKLSNVSLSVDRRLLWFYFYLKNNDLLIGEIGSSLVIINKSDKELEGKPEYFPPEEVLKKGLKIIEENKYRYFDSDSDEKSTEIAWHLKILKNYEWEDYQEKLKNIDCEYIVDRIYDCNYLPVLRLPSGRDWGEIDWYGLRGLSIDIQPGRRCPPGAECSEMPFIGFTLDFTTDGLWCSNGLGNAEKPIFN